jgi:hypothetical protein
VTHAAGGNATLARVVGRDASAVSFVGLRMPYEPWEDSAFTCFVVVVLLTVVVVATVCVWCL